MTLPKKGKVCAVARGTIPGITIKSGWQNKAYMVFIRCII
jgi:hypothetical protein